VIEALPEWSESKKTERFAVRARFRVAWETALRPSTIDQLSIPENYVRGASVLVITDEIDKVRFGRELPLTDAARAALEQVCPERGIVFGRHDYRDQIKKAAAEVLPPEKARTFTAYDLRHARATQWAESGNLVGVAYLLGHKQVTTTNRYARPNRAAAERVLLVIKDRSRPTWSVTFFAGVSPGRVAAERVVQSCQPHGRPRSRLNAISYGPTRNCYPVRANPSALRSSCPRSRWKVAPETVGAHPSDSAFLIQQATSLGVTTYPGYKSQLSARTAGNFR
jgi:hypothetical protein